MDPVSTSLNRKRPSPVNANDENADPYPSSKRAHVDRCHAPPLSFVMESKHPSIDVLRQTRQANLEREMRMLFELEYQVDVIEYMHKLDDQTRPSVETIDLQPELQWYMRPYLIDFLIEIHQQYRLRPETLYLAINIIDRYVSKRVVYKKHYQLVGCSALWIAAKFEDSKERVPNVSELSKMCCGAYEETSFIQMEGHMLSTIDWKLGHPTAESWLRIYSIGAHLPAEAKNADGYRLESSIVGHLARFLMEISLFHRSFVGLKSSVVAAAALHLSRFILGQPRRGEAETREILEIVQLFDHHLGEDKLLTISAVLMKKYSLSHCSRVSVVAKEWYSTGNRFYKDEKTKMRSKLEQEEETGMTSSDFEEGEESLEEEDPSSISSLSIKSSPTSSISSFDSNLRSSLRSMKMKNDSKNNELHSFEDEHNGENVKFDSNIQSIQMVRH